MHIVVYNILTNGIRALKSTSEKHFGMAPHCCLTCGHHNLVVKMAENKNVQHGKSEGSSVQMEPHTHRNI